MGTIPRVFEAVSLVRNNRVLSESVKTKSYLLFEHLLRRRNTKTSFEAFFGAKAQQSQPAGPNVFVFLWVSGLGIFPDCKN